MRDGKATAMGRRATRRTTTGGGLVLLLTAVLAAALTFVAQPAEAAAGKALLNNSTWVDTTGRPIEAHGGGIVKSGAYWYWFGESRNSDYSFKAVTVYRSADLLAWEYRGAALSSSSATELAKANIERPKVMFNASTGQYVMWMHKENAGDYAQARAAVATSPTIEGPYTYRGSFRPFDQYMSRDITTFVDDDGAGYMISAANENYDLNVYRLTPDYTNVATLVRTWKGDHREAPALFKRGGVYFMLTSGATGWDPNQQKYATATSLTGTWSAWQNVGDGTAFGTQTTFVLPVVGAKQTSYLYLGDVWGPGFGGVYADSRYVWLPLSFPTATTLSMTDYAKVAVKARNGVVTGQNPPYVQLVARHSGKCADVVNGDRKLGAEVIQYACGTGQNQQWQLRAVGKGAQQLVARHSHLCAAVADASTADGARIVQQPCSASPAQLWKVKAGSGSTTVVSQLSGKCLDVADESTADKARLLQWTCSGGTNQQWTLKPLG
ncbi:MAG: RICIN domain-containing protein [Kineosporiaceae bacterium]